MYVCWLPLKLFRQPFVSRGRVSHPFTMNSNSRDESNENTASGNAVGVPAAAAAAGAAYQMTPTSKK